MDQTLLELHYGLLDDEEADALRRRIETEPEVAMKWASALTLAGKFAEAAKVEAKVATKGAAAQRFDVNRREQTLEEFLAPKSKPIPTSAPRSEARSETRSAPGEPLRDRPINNQAAESKPV